MMFYKYLIFTYIICNDCILSNFNICTKEGGTETQDCEIAEYVIEVFKKLSKQS